MKESNYTAPDTGVYALGCINVLAESSDSFKLPPAEWKDPIDWK